MVMGITLIVVCALILLVWATSEFRKFKHKFWAILLITLIVFAYISFSFTIRNEDIDFTSISGVMKAGQIYFSWMGGLFTNLKRITSNAINMDWDVDSSLNSSESEEINES